jgi:hypothetical protein
MRFALILGLVLPLAATALAVPSGLPEATASSAAAPADTLRFTLTAGETLVVPLTPSNATFRGVRLPALSFIADRSFGWRTLPGERGREYVIIERRTPAPGGGARTDTLVLVVDVE